MVVGRNAVSGNGDLRSAQHFADARDKLLVDNPRLAGPDGRMKPHKHLPGSQMYTPFNVRIRHKHLLELPLANC
jgi:hypothetical protein